MAKRARKGNPGALSILRVDGDGNGSTSGTPGTVNSNERKGIRTVRSHSRGRLAESSSVPLRRDGNFGRSYGYVAIGIGDDH